ncbi:MAG TPA: Holliday junction resolvase RuvX [Candidatus Paceibacterota bacterium]|nr:Holliday junction resolvase RuvX [Candidatus Paceibacterota bacterium]
MSTKNRAQKHIGIDYGTKRIGIAISDDNGRIAFPNSVLQNDHKIIENLKKIITNGNIKKIIIGESKNYKMEDNEIMTEIIDLKKILETTLEVDVILHPEFLSSAEALNMGSTKEKIDAGAAAVILQSYLDSLK